MIGSSDISKYVLEQLKSGGINKDVAFTILKNLKKSREGADNDAAVIGMACRFPGARDADEYWTSIMSCLNCMGDFPGQRKMDTDSFIGADADSKSTDHYFKAGYLDEIDKFDAAFFRVSPKEASLMDPFQRLLLETAWESIEDAGYGGSLLSGSKTGVYMGTDHSFRVLLPSYSQMSNSKEMLGMTGLWTSILASRISYTFNLKGPGVVIDTACSSGLVALHSACKALINGDCDMAIAGGINLLLLPVKNSIFDSVESYDGVVRSFDKNANGTTWAEGVGALLVKPLKNAIEDRDSIYAVIKGSAVNNDGSSNGITAPNAQAQEAVIVKAWQEAQISPETISYVEAHGTATVLGDPIEVSGLAGAFRKFTGRRQFCAVGTVKTNIGHTVAVSGIASVIKIIKAFKNDRLPPTLNFNEPNPYINFIESPLYVAARPMDWPRGDLPRRAGISAFGLSGTNCHVLLEEPPESKSHPEAEDRRHIFMLSAKSEASLQEIIAKYVTLLQNETSISIRDLCYTLATGRGHYNYRLAILAKDIRELSEKIARIANAHPGAVTVPGIFFGCHKLVPSSKKDRQEHEISEGERLKLSSEAGLILKRYLDSEYAEDRLLEELALYYIKGAGVQWDNMYDKSEARRLHLPVYAFERNRHWFERTNATKNSYASGKPTPCYEVFWKRDELRECTEEAAACVLAIKNDHCRTDEIVAMLTSRGIAVIEARTGGEFGRLDENKFIIDGSEDNYVRLFNHLQDCDIAQIIHMASLTGGKESETPEELGDALENGVYSLLHMVKAIKKFEVDRKLDIVLISEYCGEVTEDERCIIPENAAFFGLGKAVVIENSDLRCRCIDIDGETASDRLVNELQAGFHDFCIAFRGDNRYVEAIREAKLSAFKDKTMEIREGSVCVVAGGMGGIGLELAKFISGYQKVKFAMLNRSAFPARDLWDEILDKGEDEGMCRRILGIREIERAGSVVKLYSADLSRPDQMETTVRSIKNELGGISGVFHCAGTTRQNLLINKDDGEFEGVLASKVQGAWLLDRMTRGEKPDYMVIFSSVSSLFGFPGQGDYSTANAYLDAFSVYRSRQGMRTLSINWPTWRDVGMAADNSTGADGTFKSIFPLEAMDILARIFGKSVKRIVVGEINYGNILFQGSFIKTMRLSPEIRMEINRERYKPQNRRKDTGPVVEKAQVKIKGRPGRDYSEIEDRLARIWASVLGMDTIDIYDNFHDMGGDSILASKLLKALDEEYSGIISVTDLFAYPSVVQMAEYVGKKTKDHKPASGTADGSTDGKLSGQELAGLLKDLKNDSSKMEAALDILDKVRFAEDE